MRHIAICLLGSFEVRIDRQRVTRFEYAKVRALLAYLAVESHRPHTRTWLATLLWPDQPDRAARSNLSQALTTLRNALGDRSSDRPVLLTDTDTVQIDPASGVEVDVAHFLALLRASDVHAQAHRSWRTCTPCADRLRQAMALYRDNFLADFSIADSSEFEEWAALQREHLRQRALSALGRLADWAEWRGAHADAIEYVRRQVALEPLLEVSHRALMRLLAVNGEIASALAHYQRLAQLLKHELRAEPEASTTALSDQIRRGDTSRLQSPRPPFVVPAAPTPLVGRAQDLQTVCVRLQDQSVRALTITGTGGIGKTRLAIEVAHALRYDFEDGVYFVELASLNAAGLVTDAVARALSVKERSGQSQAETLRTYVRSKHMLLVIDNFEHVVEAASFIAELLAACPTLKVLATSREPLNIRAEQLFSLEPLANVEAVQLFAARAQAHGVEVAVAGDEVAIYPEICRRLDGLPLAIELMAARAHALAPLEMLRQLDRPLQALTHGPRDLPERHRTLRSAIQWSYDLLTPTEQRVFVQLGVFAGGCTVEAAQAVTGESGPVQPILAALHQASLSQQQRVAGEVRFLMLETVHEFALELAALATEQKHLSDLRERHAQYFARFAESAEPEFLGPAQVAWMQRVDADHDNIRTAIAWCVEHAPVIGLRIAAALERFYAWRGSFRESQAWLNALLDRAGQAPPSLRAKALMISGVYAYRSARHAAATMALTESLHIFEMLGDDPASVARVHNLLGNVAYDQEQLDQAMKQYRIAMDIRRRLGDRGGVASILNNLALCSHTRNELDTAESMFEESLSLYRELGDVQSAASTLGNLASLALTRNEPQQARQLYEESLTIRREIGDRRGIGLVLNGLGHAALQLKNPFTAQTHYLAGLKVYIDLNDYVGVADSLVGLAAAAVAMDRPERAAKYLGVVDALSEDNSTLVSADTRRKMASVIEATRSTLGAVRYEATWAEGRGLTLEQTIALAEDQVR